jgi:hypothetical protein
VGQRDNGGGAFAQSEAGMWDDLDLDWWTWKKGGFELYEWYTLANDAGALYLVYCAQINPAGEAVLQVISKLDPEWMAGKA